MPIEKRQNQEGDHVDRYVPPFVINHTNVTTNDLEIVKAHRREYAHLVGEYNAMQKTFATERDYEAAKGMKDLIKEVTQREKVATLVINYFEKETKLYNLDWPKEFASLLDYEFNSIDMFQDGV